MPSAARVRLFVNCRFRRLLWCLQAILTPAAIALSARRISCKALLDFAVRLGGEISIGGIAVYEGIEHLEGHAPALVLWRTAYRTFGCGLVHARGDHARRACGLTRVGYALAAVLRMRHLYIAGVFFGLLRARSRLFSHALLAIRAVVAPLLFAPNHSLDFHAHHFQRGPMRLFSIAASIAGNILFSSSGALADTTGLVRGIASIDGKPAAWRCY